MPVQVIEDMSVQANVPALAMEEVVKLLEIVKTNELEIECNEKKMNAYCRLHLWLSQMQPCLHLKKYLKEKVTSRKR